MPASEATPLLAGAIDEQGAATPRLTRTPLPTFQLFIVLFLRVCEPICFACCFPFINQYILELGIVHDAKQTGFYAGMIESVFALAELTTVFFWGSLSDRIGRKPVLLIGCVAAAISATCFGLSTTLAGLIVSRSISGLANGNVAVLKSVIGEITDETNQARAFSFFPLSLATGNILASFIGGYLAHPVDRFPSLGTYFPILEVHPYFLPCFVAALFPLLSGLLAWAFMRETLPADLGHDEPVSAWAMLRDADLRNLLVSFALLSLESIAFGALLPLFLFTPVELGGVSFSEASIGTALAIRGVAMISTQLFAFPYLVEKVGNTRLFNILTTLFVPTFLGLPLINAFARTGSAAAVWASVTAVVTLSSIANMAFACNLIMTNNAAPSRKSLGALNGLAAVASALTRVVGPGAANSLFALSIDKHLLGGALIWVWMCVLALATMVAGWPLKKTYGGK